MASSISKCVGANEARNLRLASVRKSYQLSFHFCSRQRRQNSQGYVSITETRLATGNRRTLPCKFQVVSSTQEPLHRTRRPAQSILRRRSDSRKHETNSDGRTIRFAIRPEQRFYAKGTRSRDQLVKLSWKDQGFERGTRNANNVNQLVDIMADTSLSEDDTSSKRPTINDVVQAIRTGKSVKDIVQLLQHEQTDLICQYDQEESLATLYEHVKKQLHSNQTPHDNTNNLSQIRKLLCIYKHAESVIANAQATKQWGRFEVTVDSISNLDQLTVTKCDTSLAGDMFFRSSIVAGQKLGSIPTCNIVQNTIDYRNIKADSVNNKGATIVYCINHNFGPADERPELTLRLFYRSQELGHVRIPSSVFRFFSKQPKETYTLCQTLRQPTAKTKVNGSIRVKFSIRKVNLKADFLASKRREIATRLDQVIDWIQRFNIDNNEILSSHIVSSLDSSSLLHAAILAQDRRLVGKLMSTGSNPHDSRSSMGSAMTLALNLSDRHCRSDQKEFFDMIKYMQLVQTRWDNNAAPKPEATTAADSGKENGSAVTNRNDKKSQLSRRRPKPLKPHNQIAAQR